MRDIEEVLSCGAAKVSINSGALKNPKFMEEAAKRYGSSRVILSMDVKRVNASFRVFEAGGQVDTGLDALEWARQGQESGAGELVINSIDADGVQSGYDLELLGAIQKYPPAGGGLGRGAWSTFWSCSKKQGRMQALQHRCFISARYPFPN